jgi:ankyrin repeat protein
MRTKNNQPPLFFACLNGHTAIIELFDNHGAKDD